MRFMLSYADISCKEIIYQGSVSLQNCIFYLQVQDIVDDYKNANLTISKNCKKISEMLLVKIDGKRVYDNLEFEEEQVNCTVEPVWIFHLEEIVVGNESLERVQDVREGGSR